MSLVRAVGRLLGWACALMAALSMTPARAQFDTREGILLRDHILELRQEVQQLREQVARGQQGGYAAGSSLGAAQIPPPPGPPSDLNAQLLDRVQRLEDEVRLLRGRLDESENARQRDKAELAKQIADLTFRLDGMAHGPAAGAPPAAPQPGAPATGAPTPPPPPPPPAKRTAEIALQEGNTALQRRDYATSEALAREVMAMPKTPRQTDAQFLLAQSLAGRKDWSGAAVAYDDTYNRNHTGAHAQDSLLGLANALNALNEKRAACATLEKLRAEFPAPRADVRDAAAAVRRAAACR